MTETLPPPHDRSHTNPWVACVLTLFPELFPGALAGGLTGKSLERGLWALETVNIRDFALEDRHQTVDDTCFGGGPGMVMRPDVVGAAIEATQARIHAAHGCTLPLLYLSPKGTLLTQEKADALAAGPGIILLSGRYEGIDQRILDVYPIEEVSIGDYVLTGGEIPAMVLLDACVRLLEGTVHNPESLAHDSLRGNLLECPHYTRPRIWAGQTVPDVLLSGNHQAIEMWRHAASESLTQARRPDLWEKYCVLRDAAALLKKPGKKRPSK